jgi:hypothetical protein
MPFKSQAQRAWAYTKEGTKALGGKKAVAEWEKATGNKKLPKKASKAKQNKPYIALATAQGVQLCDQCKLQKELL